MGEQTALGYMIMAARAAHMTVAQEEKLVEAMRKVMKEQLPSDALDLYMEWIGYDEKEAYLAELEQAASVEGMEVA